ncbi:M1 family aminopeptidase [Pedobacter sp. MC2016-15]|uniref:M1 family metallopeptidase n=1 Tax=Pedobacter sp. MC2016-15 TaxID=2994473 RepID=UPI0022465722|nr:M1 family aminopeptidase [Pedobacter sp. MC2016-15]MCX2477836.1 M1 family aminopeptidase [Pedobacter sp. MC2016-15]
MASFSLVLSCSSRKAVTDPLVEPGVGRSLAIYRKAVLSDVRYMLDLDLPVQKAKPIAAHETLTFSLNSLRLPVQLDFKEDPAKISGMSINGKTVEVDYQKEHLLLRPDLLKMGVNVVQIDFTAGNGALNRNPDYLYTLFVPDRARTVFPCFDQPDLKAVYTLTLHIPQSWKAIANAELRDSVIGQNDKTYHFKPSNLLSTYHFAFAAGDFKLHSATLNQKNTQFLYRETDQAKITPSLPAVYAIHNSALKYFENWTGIPYPYQKFGFLAIPDFQFGGMEHPGAIQYKASSLFLDEGATKDQLNSRNTLIAHETAHMWFGDLVTMDWFSDVWMKEVFANFMADKSDEEAGGQDAYALKFLIDHFPAAYAVDRTSGANPIRQPLDNLQDAGSLYGNIIYHKAPVMMQQLENLMGKERFQQGVREYLRKFSNGNASWPDLIRILDRYTPSNLQDWNKVWVNESGRPVITYSLTTEDSKIKRLQLSQRSEYGPSRIWPQSFEVSLFYPGSVKVIRVNLNKDQLVLKEAEGLPEPQLILFNSAGDGYGEWPVDQRLPEQLYSLQKPLHRATAYISLYEQMLSGKAISPARLITVFGKSLENEQEELNIRLLSNYLSTLYWQLSSPAQRKALSGTLENQIWTALLKQKSSNNKKHLFKAYQDIFMSAEARKRIYQIWDSQLPPAGIVFSEDDYTSMAFALALRDDADPALLAVQNARITNPDRKRRFEFIVPAVSGDKLKRDNFFNSLKSLPNRAKESNVLAALYYLHHPLRQASSMRYLKQSLELLQEIQSTGDIFFPQSWLQATFGSYQSKPAADIVRGFLEAHPGYNPRLRAKILQNTDNLFRAEKLLH